MKDLFNENFDPEQEWQDMPEFVQKKQRPYAKIVFRFETEEDLKEFNELIGQKLTKKTKSSWHPFKPHNTYVKRYYINESKVSDLRDKQGEG